MHTSHPFLPRIGFLGLLCALAAPLASQSRKLNGPLAPLTDAGGAARILDFEFSPDGQRVVYRGDHDLSGSPGLYSVPSDGSAPAVRLSTGGAATDFEISPTGAYVAYRSLGLYGLSLVPIDGSQAPLQLASSYFVQYEFTTDGTRLVYSSGGLWVVPVTGGTPLRLGETAYRLALSPDGTQAVFQVRKIQQGGIGDITTDELWRVPLDGSAAPTRLNVLGAFQFESEMREFQLSPDGRRVVYWSSPNATGRYEPFSARLDSAPNPVQLAHFGSGDYGGSSTISADSTVVVYAAATEVYGRMELYRVPLDGVPSTRLNGPLVEGGSTADYLITADDRYVVYRADQEVEGVFRLYVVPLHGHGALWRIDSPGVGRFALTADGEHVVFEATDDPLNRFRQLYSARLQESPHARRFPERAHTTAAVCLNRSMFAYGGLDSFALSPDSRSVVYTARQDSYAVELYSVDVEGALPPVRRWTSASSSSRWTSRGRARRSP